MRDKGRLDDAIEAYRQSIAHNPNFYEAHNNLGIVLNDKGFPDQAIAACQRAIALMPTRVQAYNNLGNVLKSQGQIPAAIEVFRQAIALDPNSPKVHSNLIYAMHFDPACDPQAIAAESLYWNELHAQLLRENARPRPNDLDPRRRLKVGYVSPDFRFQAEAFFVIPLLRAHDHGQFEIHCYASVAQPDQITAQLKGSADVWHDVIDKSDQQLADLICQDQIDVLVDLTMHMANNRLLTFAQKPAPVQVAWLAYPGGTGLAAMDYRLTDAFMDPPGKTDSLYVEKSIRLPDCWCCYDPLCDPLPIAPPPAVNCGYITFGSLNNFCKINPEVLSLWARLLCAVPDSHLLLLTGEGEHRRRTQDFLEARGINPNRVEFQMQCPQEEYLHIYDRIDIALDPFPYNGITTSCDALWMGVPVITLVGTAAASRAGLSLLSTVGLTELAAHTAEQFVEITARLVRDLPKLGELRSTLRRRMEQSPLMDAPKFARNIEAAYRRMSHIWCQTT